MKTKLLILSAFVALSCVSCGQNGTPESSIGTENSSSKEITESNTTEEITESSTTEEITESSSSEAASEIVTATESSAVEETTEMSFSDKYSRVIDIPENDEEMNTVDNEMTEKGNTLAYKVHVKSYDKDGNCTEYTEVRNCFNDILLYDGNTYLRYECMYNSEGLILEYKGIDRGSDVLYRYDKYGNLTRTITKTGPEAISMAIEKYQNKYDSLGKLIECTYSTAGYRTSEFPSGYEYIRKYKYDENGNLIEEWEDDSLKNAYTYDDRGNKIVKEEHPNYTDSVHRYVTEYNSRDLPVTEEMYVDGELKARWEYEYEFYDDRG